MPSKVSYCNKTYLFVIPKGFCWNGANVPPFAWLIIGERTDPRFKLASCIHDFLCEHHGVIGRGIKARDDLHVLKRTKAPAVLVECGFISNAKEESLLKTKPEIFANAIFEAIKKIKAEKEL